MQVMNAAEVGDLNLFRRGKVRDTFQLADGTLLMIATDRLSVFDVVLPTAIPGKGTVLTQMSRWWFAQTAGIMPNHLLPDLEEAIPESVRSDWLPRSMHVGRAQRIDVECVVRGFISGSGWKEYRDKGTLAGEPVHEGLRDSSRLPSPRFTPAIKKDDGHDVNISRNELRALVGQSLADQLESASLRLFDFATARCEGVGIYLADTKFEFGFVDGKLTLIDEIFT
ncbi:MAG: phosphoribosylaminoimidazolesuccinocarboxamide synthase, partial [Candidatus Dormiibacterota bacterium]